MRYKLGKTSARNAVSFLFSDYFDATKLPTPPAVFGHYQGIQWHMLANDKYGCCLFSGGAHKGMLWSLEGGRPRSRFTSYDVLSDYAENTGFDIKQTDAKGNNPTDNGADMQQIAAFWKNKGMLSADGTRHRIDGYLALQKGNWDELVLATYLFGAAGVGLQLPQSAMDQFDAGHPWTVPTRPKIIGGHYVPSVGRDANGNVLVVTWGAVIPMTQLFYQRFSDEAIAYVSLEVLNAKGLSPEGYDADELRKHLGSLA